MLFYEVESPIAPAKPEGDPCKITTWIVATALAASAFATICWPFIKEFIR